MKPVLWYTAILFLPFSAVYGQTKPAKASHKKTIHSKNNLAQKPGINERDISSKTITLSTTTNYPAKANFGRLSATGNSYTVTDPILTTLNARANGANIPFNKSGIVGMPKRAYGFANGHIMLRTTGAVTNGTQTGSGSVGTGSSLATFGSIGAPMNVNGKSPYAGVNMWGTAMNLEVTKIDSSVKLSPVKKQ